MPLLDYIASPGLGTLVHFDPYASLVHWPAESSLMVNNSTVDGGFTATQNKILTSIKATVAATSLLFTLFYLLYIFVRSVVGLSWFFLENYRSSQKAKRLDDLSSTRTLTVVNESWKEYWRRMRLSCLFLSNPLTRILVSLQLAEMMDDAQVMIEVFDLAKYDSLCMIQALIFQYFGFAKLSWSFVVSIWMIWILVLRKTSTLLMIEIASHVIAWGLPIIVTVVPIITKSYGNLGKFCWIKNDQIGNWLRFGLNYIPLWVIIALTLGMYLFTISWIARTQYATYRGLSSSNRFKKVSMSLTLYIKLLGLPFIFMVLWIFPTTTRIIETATGGKKYFPLFLLMNLTRYAHGLCNTLLIMLCAAINWAQQNLQRRKEFIEETDLGDQRTINEDGMYETFIEMEVEDFDNEE